ncbi:MAG: glycosyltransferase family 39 protein [Pseudomonadota bacterium]
MSHPDGARPRHGRLAWGLAVLLALAWFANLDGRALIRPDEGRYAEIARHMAMTGDWLTPRLNGIKYFFKPPLQAWASAAAFDLFGLHHWTARLWSALTGFLGIVLLGAIGARLYGARTGLIAAAVLGSAGLYVGIGHLNTLDMGLTFFMSAAMGFILLGLQSPAGSRRELHWMLGAWVAMALAVLSKGLVGVVLPLGGVAIAALLALDWRLPLRMRPLAGGAVFMLVAAPWFIAVSLRNPEFAHFFFIHEHFERFLTTVHRRGEPWWFFLEVQALGSHPWLFAMLAGLLGAWRADERFARTPVPPNAPAARPARLLACWAVLIVLFFSLSSSKLPSYTLPAWPALALLAALHLAQATPRVLAAHCAVAAVLAACGLALSPLIGARAESAAQALLFPQFARYVAIAAAMVLASAIVATVLVLRRRSLAGILVLSFGALLGWQAMIAGYDRLSPMTGVYHLVRQAERDLRDAQPDTPFYSVEVYDQTLNFYLRRETTLVAFRDELDFGLGVEPDRWIPTTPLFEERWRRDPLAFAIMPPATFDRLSAQGLPMRLLARDERRALVRTVPPDGAEGSR